LAGERIDKIFSLNLTSGDYYLRYSTSFFNEQMWFQVVKEVDVYNYIRSASYKDNQVKAELFFYNRGYANILCVCTMMVGGAVVEKEVNLVVWRDEIVELSIPGDAIGSGTYDAVIKAGNGIVTIFEKTFEVTIPDAKYEIVKGENGVSAYAGTSGMCELTIRNTGSRPGIMNLKARCLDIVSYEESHFFELGEEFTFQIPYNVPEDFPGDIIRWILI
jgi:hypothetical protein